MATKTFLTDQELINAEILYVRDVSKKYRASRATQKMVNEFGQWLEDRLLEKLAECGDLDQVGLVALGSWGRGELSLRSDIDVLLTGEEKASQAFIATAFEKGLKLRARTPQSASDWTKGVEAFDVLSILQGKGFDDQTQKKLELQKEIIWQRSLQFRKLVLSRVVDERQSRRKRFDSVANYLEPNLKFGPGGLRDLQQARSLVQLFPDKFSGLDVEKVLAPHSLYFTGLRHRLHLNGGQDIVQRGLVPDLANWAGYDDFFEFAKQLQVQISEAEFYSSYLIDLSRRSRKRVMEQQAQPVKTVREAFKILAKDPSILNQERVREFLQNARPVLSDSLRGKLFQSYIHPKHKYEFFSALIGSKLFDVLIPEFKLVRGLVQYDQYHKFTVGTHVLKTIEQVLDLQKRAKRTKGLFRLARQLTEVDWQLLLWTAIFHDLAKGQKGDHSTLGAELVREIFTKFSISLRKTIEVSWLVEKHLVLSGAAFRRNPASAETWEYVFRHGVKGERLLRLTLFTAMDIRATNPEAWTPWKERLLFDLYQQLETPGATQFSKLLDQAAKKDIELSPAFIEGLDPSLVGDLPVSLLVKDYEHLKQSKADLPPLIWSKSKEIYWIRLHRFYDRPGVLADFVKRIYGTSSSILQCSVQTFSQYGVYDWFQVRFRGDKKVLAKRLKLTENQTAPDLEIYFDSIDVVSRTTDGAIVSFRGKDQKGALMVAAKALSESGLEIQWAKAHTWGRQLDDVFYVRASEHLDQCVDRLRVNLIRQAFAVGHERV